VGGVLTSLEDPPRGGEVFATDAKQTNLSTATPISKRALLLVLALLSLTGCVSTPQGTKFDPIEGGKRLNQNLDTTIDRLQDRSYQDSN